jgi:hypothetical protein
MVYKDLYTDEPEYPASFYDDSFDFFILRLFKKYNSLNILLKRDDTTYDENGRFQNLKESKKIDESIKHKLIIHDIPFIEFPVYSNTAEDIFNYIINKNI